MREVKHVFDTDRIAVIQLIVCSYSILDNRILIGDFLREILLPEGVSVNNSSCCAVFEAVVK